MPSLIKPIIKDLANIVNTTPLPDFLLQAALGAILNHILRKDGSADSGEDEKLLRLLEDGRIDEAAEMFEQTDATTQDNLSKQLTVLVEELGRTDIQTEINDYNEAYQRARRILEQTDVRNR